MKEISLKGSFYEMGIKYGKECKKEIKSFCFMARMMADIIQPQMEIREGYAYFTWNAVTTGLKTSPPSFRSNFEFVYFYLSAFN